MQAAIEWITWYCTTCVVVILCQKIPIYAFRECNSRRFSHASLLAAAAAVCVLAWIIDVGKKLSPVSRVDTSCWHVLNTTVSNGSDDGVEVGAKSFWRAAYNDLRSIIALLVCLHNEMSITLISLWFQFGLRDFRMLDACVELRFLVQGVQSCGNGGHSIRSFGKSRP